MADAPKTEKLTVRAADFRAVYANAFRFRVTNNEVVVTVGFDTVGTDNQPLLIDEAQLIMTPQMAKLLIEAFQVTLAAHEKAHGIKLTADPAKLVEFEKTIQAGKR